ncbi:gamma-glutamylcyclotransferase [Rhodobacterales bacterium HKCCE4037]|nr:gamma-glutamylcyclotransferase [Rhodobacterales bacterium HKCCE4037]
MSDPYFFGYGSLVNRQTHSYPEAARAHVRGWRRAWQGTSLRKVAYLTAVPDSEGEIAGLIAAVPGADWAALDKREGAYARHPVAAFGHGREVEPLVQIYAVEDAHAAVGDHPILLSYLDTVIQGYLAEFGEDGAREFFDTTDGWHLPLLDDRADPIYPRATEINASEREFVDDNLARVAPKAVRNAL